MRNWLKELSPAQPLPPWGHFALWAMLVALFVFFAITLHREAFQQPRRGDLGVYLRTAWAAREGESLYQIVDDHGWHYNYPPLLASVLIPLADPPADVPESARVGIPPYWLSAVIWFWLSVACIAGSVHLIAAALEATASKRDPPPVKFSLGWWALRILPLITTLFFVGGGIARGQVTPIVLLFLAGSAATILRGRSVRAGLWLGFAVMLKLFPAYLLIYPLWRRDRRFLAGAAAAMVAGFLFPFATMGPSAAFASYREFVDQRLLGEAVRIGNPDFSDELYGTNSSIQGFEYMIYNSLHPNRQTRASQPPMPYVLAHIALSGLLTAGALWAMRRRGDPLAEFLAFAALCLLMVPILPVSRPHYYSIGLLALAGLYAAKWPRQRGLWAGWPVALVSVAFAVTGALDVFGIHLALEWGLATYAALAVVYLSLSETWRRSRDMPIA